MARCQSLKTHKCARGRCRISSSSAGVSLEQDLSRARGSVLQTTGSRDGTHCIHGLRIWQTSTQVHSLAVPTTILRSSRHTDASAKAVPNNEACLQISTMSSAGSERKGAANVLRRLFKHSSSNSRSLILASISAMDIGWSMMLGEKVLR
jgi:hypothetical protein